MAHEKSQEKRAADRALAQERRETLYWEYIQTKGRSNETDTANLLLESMQLYTKIIVDNAESS